MKNQKGNQTARKEFSMGKLEKKSPVELYPHLGDYFLIGGLTSPVSNGYWKTLPSVKIKRYVKEFFSL